MLSGGNDGIVEYWDYRIRSKIKRKILNNGQEITEIKSDNGGLLYGIGSSKGLLRIYDVRQDTPLLELTHHYKMPINKIIFHDKTRSILSSCRRVIKINNKVIQSHFSFFKKELFIN